MKLLAIVSGEYGRRHVENIKKHGPEAWQIAVWQAPQVLPPIVDYPEDYLPDSFAPADLILSFAEHKGVAELLPDIAKMTGARGVVAAVDSEAWLPRGLARQLRGWLERKEVVCVTPKPLCSLTETDFGVTWRQRIEYECEEISAFAKHFGQPELELEVDPNSRTIVKSAVKRDAVCGCARFVAEGLVGVSVDEAEEKAGLLHHHYPCMASMGKDVDFNMDTLMHASGNILKRNVAEQIKEFKQVRYFRPGNISE
ncbi:MAG: DUF166 family protein [Anaerolineales bacterium]|jgi:hypothetical protein